MSKRLALPWREWSAITRQIYLQTMRGWPATEMRIYWQRGLSPLQAMESAAKRRLKSKEPQ